MTVTVAVTGATGSLGRSLIPKILETTEYNVAGISRNELLQEQCRRAWAQYGDRVTLYPCDICDLARLTDTFLRLNVNWVVHAAALKRVPNSYWFASEYMRINVIGTMNVVDACLSTGVTKLLFISTDKACEAHNVYGATKRVAEALVLERGGVVVRGGNVGGSNGSVVRMWMEQAVAEKPITLYDPNATRFHLRMDYWCNFILARLENYNVGVIHAPMLKSYEMGELFRMFEDEWVGPPLIANIEGVRRGDKQHEVLVSRDEMPFTLLYPMDDPYFTVFPEAVGGMPTNAWFGGYTSEVAERISENELIDFVISNIRGGG